MNAVEQRYRLTYFVGLQRSDEVQFNVGITLLQFGPLRPRLLHTIFAKNPMTGVEHREDTFGTVGFGHRNQVDRRRRRDSRMLRLLDALKNGLEVFGGIARNSR